MAVRLANQAEPIPGYKLIERLGRGGFGEVWKAEAPGGLHKAIKFVYGDLDEGKDGGAGAQELKALNRVKTVRHPFILSLERVDIVEGQLVIVMELADRNLMDRFRECQNLNLPGIPREEILRYMEEAAEALDLMNIEYQLQHLDIKPQNLFLVRNHIKVADFGLVKDLEGMKATITGGVTPLYAAPETFENWVSRYCDQYSLAIVYQELLTGVRPFDGANARQLLKQHLEQEPNVDALPAADRDIIRRALAKKPTDRFPSCSYMVRMLRGGAGADDMPTLEAVTASPPAPRPEARQTPSPARAEEPEVLASVDLSSPDAPTSLYQKPGPDEGAGQDANSQTWQRQGMPVTDRLPAKVATSPPGAAAMSDTNRVAMQPSAPVEFKGPGVLYPALVIGLGQMGLLALQQLRAAVIERFGTMDAVPNLRLLGIDTDPEAMSAAARGARGAGLNAREMLLARLNRPSHFVKPRDGAVPYQTWLDPQLLYRIPRSQLTAGMRCLGRLAFTDNYREIADRLRSEIATCTEAEVMAAADRQTKLGLRSNRPRVWIINSLSGGTGSGMFLDAAYLTRFFLKQLGFAQPDLAGVFFVPATTAPSPQRPLAVVNTYTALGELHHFANPGTIFSARYALKEPLVTDTDPPFGRSFLVPSTGDERKARESAGHAAALLYRDLFTPLGRIVEARRPAPRPTAAVPPVASFGLNRLSWPRRALVQQIARRLCLRIAQHWSSKDAAQLVEPVAAWAKEQWTKRQLGADRLLLCLKAACEGVMDDHAPEEVFENIVVNLAKNLPQGANPDPARIRAALDEIEKLVGKPDTDKPPLKLPTLVDGLEKTAKSLLTGSEQKLAEMAVHLVEQPRFRLAGAEEAIRQFTGFLQAAVAQQEPLGDEFIKRSNEAYARLTGHIDMLTNYAAAKKKAPPIAGDVFDLLRIYPTLRLRGLMVQRVLTILRSMRGNCPEYLREFGYCRARLLDLVRAFEAPLPTDSALNLGKGHDLFPPGCNTLDETVNKFLEQVTEEEMLDLDQRIQVLLRRQFTALVHVCTTAANLLRDLELVMYTELETFVATRLGTTNAVETFLAQYAEDRDAKAEMTAAFKDAAPLIALDSKAGGNEMGVVLVPADPSADDLKQLVRQALPAAGLETGAKGDDIVFYRESPGLAFTELPQMGPDAVAAYKELKKNDSYTPHNRSDITEWRLPGQR